jgi:hypothetical protein
MDTALLAAGEGGMTVEKDYFLLHRWANCPACGPMVICGKCGNNCCNGGYGVLADGSDCDACPSAYDLQGIGTPPDSLGLP